MPLSRLAVEQIPPPSRQPRQGLKTPRPKNQPNSSKLHAVRYVPDSICQLVFGPCPKKLSTPLFKKLRATD
jgi:hypothetical protein